jgi:hypothetical protein
MREALERCLPEPVADTRPAPQISEAVAEIPQTPSQAWRRRVGVMVGEAVATAAVAGTLLLLVLTILG